MKRILTPAILLALLGICENSLGQHDFFTFRDVASQHGLSKVLDDGKFYAHAAAWGDADGDGWIDLFVGSMAGKGPPHALFWNNKGKLAHDPQKVLDRTSRATGAVFADLNNNGLLDLYVSNHVRGRWPVGPGLPNLLYRTKPNRVLEEIKGSGASPGGLIGRCIAVMDYDGDGLLDLFVPSRPSQGKRVYLFRNLGNMKFADTTAKAGLPLDIFGLGAAAADVTGNSWPDLFVGGSNRLFVNKGDGTFREAKELTPVWGREHDREDLSPSCGVAFGDVNRDGRPDLVIGTHPDYPWSKDPMPIRLYLNQGSSVKKARFVEVTEKAGLSRIWMRAPHVAIRDFDNDGLPDLMTSTAVFKGNDVRPLIYKNMGGPVGGVPKFQETALRHQPDFPTAKDKTLRRPFYDTVPKNPRVFYYPVGPTGDFNNDGRLDIFFARGWPYIPARLLRNETPGGHYLDVELIVRKGMNRQGVGAVVRAYEAGKAGVPVALFYSEEISVSYGYCSGHPAIAHLGLGERFACDLEIVLPHGRGTIRQTDVNANQRITISK